MSAFRSVFTDADGAVSGLSRNEFFSAVDVPFEVAFDHGVIGVIVWPGLIAFPQLQ